MIKDRGRVVARRVQGVCVGGREKTELADWAKTSWREEAGEACRGVKREACTFGLTEEGDESLQALSSDSKVCG